MQAARPELAMRQERFKSCFYPILNSYVWHPLICWRGGVVSAFGGGNTCH